MNKYINLFVFLFSFIFLNISNIFNKFNIFHFTPCSNTQKLCDNSCFLLIFQVQGKKPHNGCKYHIWLQYFTFSKLLFGHCFIYQRYFYTIFSNFTLLAEQSCIPTGTDTHSSLTFTMVVTVRNLTFIMPRQIFIYSFIRPFIHSFILHSFINSSIHKLNFECST